MKSTKRSTGNSEDVRNCLMQDLAIILNNENASKNVKNNAINYAIYNWTEANGKYEGNKYWSINAYEEYAYERNRPYKLVHEHIVPRNIIRDKIFRELEVTKKIDSLSLYLLFYKFVIATVITKAEDELFNKEYDEIKLRSKMPKGYYINQKNRENWYENVWARYFAVNEKAEIMDNEITIYEIIWNGSKEKDIKISFKGFDYREVAEKLII